MQPCEDDLVCKLENKNVPYFNAMVYKENKTEIGKVEDIFGPVSDAYFTVKLGAGMKAGSFKPTDKFFIDPYKLLPIERFLPGKKPARGGGRGGRGGRGGHGGGRGGGRGGFRGGRGGGFRGGRGGGGGRGGFRGGRGGGGGFRGGRGGGGGFRR